MKAQRYFPSAQIEESAYYKVTSDRYVMYGCLSHYGYHIQVTTERKYPMIQVESFDATHAGLRDEVDFLVKNQETFDYIDEKEFTDQYNKVQKDIADRIYDASLKP